ncbi:hypothetical protein D3C87_1571830 [compost metagenome]
MFLDSKVEPQSFTSSPKFFAYQSFVSFGLSEKKKIPPIPVTFGVLSEVELSDCFFESSIVLLFWFNLTNLRYIAFCIYLRRIKSSYTLIFPLSADPFLLAKLAF